MELDSGIALKKIKLYSEDRDHRATINDVPSEILLNIFSILPKQEAFVNLRLVCQRWNNLIKDPFLWKTIDMDYNQNHVLTSEDAIEWVQSATLLQHLTVVIKGTFPAVKFLEQVSLHCPHLETLRITGSGVPEPDSLLLQTTASAHVFLRCNKLRVCNIRITKDKRPLGFVNSAGCF